MFLATTAIENFWDKSQNILFLGEWCLLYDRAAELKKIDYEVLPYHWDDREKLYSDYQYIDDLYEKLLVDLTANLNLLFGQDRPVRYYRIILGWWLCRFVGIVFDRYCSIERAFESKKDLYSHISRFEYGDWTCNDFSEFESVSLSDSYNYYLFSKILEAVNPESCRVVAAGAYQSVEKYRQEFPQAAPAAGVIKKMAKSALAAYEKAIPSCLNKIVFVSSYICKKSQFLLQLKLKQLPYWGFADNSAVRYPVNRALRQKIHLEFLPKNEFEKFLCALLAEQLPTKYLEGHSDFLEKAHKLYPYKPETVLTANAVYHNDEFKFWVADSVCGKTKFYYLQHGGCYGQTLFQTMEKHEISISDRYFSWGWNDGSGNVVSLPSPKLSLIKKIQPKKDGTILQVLMSLPRYSYHLFSVPIGAGATNRYLKDQFEFVANLNNTARKKLLVRPFLYEYGQNQPRQFKSMFPDVKLCRNEKSFYERLKEARLFIGTYNSTTYLEAFALNFPTVLFLDPKSWELRESALQFFQLLQDCKILFPNPQEAAKHVNKIFDNVDDWWYSSHVQEARREFSHVYARTDKKWMDMFQGELSAAR